MVRVKRFVVVETGRSVDNLFSVYCGYQLLLTTGWSYYLLFRRIYYILRIRLYSFIIPDKIAFSIIFLAYHFRGGPCLAICV